VLLLPFALNHLTLQSGEATLLSKKPTSLQETDCSLLLSFYLENKHKPKRVLEDIPVC
jgi:hypothetical protein